MELLMIDKFFYKLFGTLDNILYWFTAPRCKCKLKKKKNER